MKKVVSTIFTIITIIVSLLLSGIVIGIVKENIAKTEVTDKVNSSLEEVAVSLNSRCPIRIDSWTTIESVSYKNKEMVYKYVVDEEVIGVFTPDGYKREFINSIANQLSRKELIEFGEDLSQARVSIKLLIFHSNGTLEHTVQIDGYNLKKASLNGAQNFFGN